MGTTATLVAYRERAKRIDSEVWLDYTNTLVACINAEAAAYLGTPGTGFGEVPSEERDEFFLGLDGKHLNAKARECFRLGTSSLSPRELRTLMSECKFGDNMQLRQLGRGKNVIVHWFYSR